jgi:hypothetical protein
VKLPISIESVNLVSISQSIMHYNHRYVYNFLSLNFFFYCWYIKIINIKYQNWIIIVNNFKYFVKCCILFGYFFFFKFIALQIQSSIVEYSNCVFLVSCDGLISFVQFCRRSCFSALSCAMITVCLSILGCSAIICWTFVCVYCVSFNHI